MITYKTDTVTISYNKYSYKEYSITVVYSNDPNTIYVYPKNIVHIHSSTTKGIMDMLEAATALITIYHAIQ